MTTSTETRRAGIIEMLGFGRYLKVADLSQRFGVSQMSIRRDLHHLEGQGMLQRMHGGLIATRFCVSASKISSNIAYLN